MAAPLKLVGAAELVSSTSVRLRATHRGQCFMAGRRDLSVRLRPQREQLAYLVSRGVGGPLDPHGSLTDLKHLDARFVKIDMEFIRELVSNDTDQQVVTSIVDIAHSLGKRTVAEGVEDAATVAALKLRGVDYAQGFHLGRPQLMLPGAPVPAGA